MLPDRVATAVLGSLAEAVTVQDEDGRMVYANDAAARLLAARDVDEVLHAQPGELASRFTITREDGSPVGIGDLPGHRLLRGEPDVPPLLTRSVRRDTGQELWLLTKASLFEAVGRRYAVNIIEDVTVAKRTELRRRYLDQAGQALNANLELGSTLQRVAQLAVPWLADWCAVTMPDDRGRLRQVALAHIDPRKLSLGRELGERYPPRGDEPTGAPNVIRTGSPEVYPAITDDILLAVAKDDHHLEVLRELGMRAAMIVPMRAGPRTIGAISFVSAESGRTYTDDDVAFAEDLGARAGAAVDNARLYTERRDVARTLQDSLLPERLADVPGWESAAAYAAGEIGSEVGGDFYDIFPVAGGAVVLLGDVTGKGVRAAALTAAARHTARTAALFDPRPAAVLGLVNRVLRDRTTLSPVTMVCALLGEGSLTVASAGHPLPLVRRESGLTEPVGEGSVLLGVVDEPEWPEHDVDVEPGEILLFYTDGVTDTPGAGGRFGERRLRAAVQSAHPSPQALVAAVDAAVRDHQTGAVGDDRAMLALRRVG